jgi:hypothetical protein
MRGGDAPRPILLRQQPRKNTAPLLVGPPIGATFSTDRPLQVNEDQVVSQRAQQVFLGRPIAPPQMGLVNYAVPFEEFLPASQPPPCYIDKFNVGGNETSQCICVMGVPCITPTGDRGRYLASRIAQPIFCESLSSYHTATLRHREATIEVCCRISQMLIWD